jgi:hypothetical protein
MCSHVVGRRKVSPLVQVVDSHFALWTVLYMTVNSSAKETIVYLSDELSKKCSYLTRRNQPDLQELFLNERDVSARIKLK